MCFVHTVCAGKDIYELCGYTRIRNAILPVSPLRRKPRSLKRSSQCCRLTSILRLAGRSRSRALYVLCHLTCESLQCGSNQILSRNRDTSRITSIAYSQSRAGPFPHTSLPVQPFWVFLVAQLLDKGSLFLIAPSRPIAPSDALKETGAYRMNISRPSTNISCTVIPVRPILHLGALSSG